MLGLCQSQSEAEAQAKAPSPASPKLQKVEAEARTQQSQYKVSRKCSSFLRLECQGLNSECASPRTFQDINSFINFKINLFVWCSSGASKEGQHCGLVFRQVSETAFSCRDVPRHRCFKRSVDPGSTDWTGTS